jgi:hypothetical protein
MRRIASYICYWAAEAVSRVGNLWPNWDTPIIVGSYYWMVYRPYQFLLTASINCQGTGSGPWGPEL